MEKISMEQWKKDGKEKYGENYSDWEFVCPNCGRVNKVSEFEEKGLTKMEAVNSACVECIGRYEKTKGCDWAGYGLFGVMGKGITVIGEDGKENEVFKFSK